MLHNLLDSVSLLRVVAEKAAYKVNKLLAQRIIFPVDVFLGQSPEATWLLLHESVVLVSVHFGIFEWRGCGSHDEEDYTAGEHINLRSFVWLSLVDLWSHVPFCSQHRSKLVRAILGFRNAGGETEISQFEVELSVEKEVVGFEISVAVAVLITRVETFH